jgi:hypothetical protein
MVQWIVTSALYVAGFGTLALLGGVAAAGDAIRRWSERSISPADSRP